MSVSFPYLYWLILHIIIYESASKSRLPDLSDGRDINIVWNTSHDGASIRDRILLTLTPNVSAPSPHHSHACIFSVSLLVDFTHNYLWRYIKISAPWHEWWARYWYNLKYVARWCLKKISQTLNPNTKCFIPFSPSFSCLYLFCIFICWFYT
jgi:hypothetical protein